MIFREKHEEQTEAELQRLLNKDPEACPHCGWTDPDLWEYHRNGSHEVECASCGGPITVTVSTEVVREVFARAQKVSS